MTLTETNKGELALVAAIINQALMDATLKRYPRDPSSRKKRKIPYRDNENMAWMARRFFDVSDADFCMYCELLDIEPDYVATKAIRYFMKFDTGNKPSFRKMFVEMEKKRSRNLSPESVEVMDIHPLIFPSAS